MHEQNVSLANCVVSAEPMKPRRRLGGLLGLAAPRFEPSAEVDQFMVLLKPDGQREVRLITSAEQLRSGADSASAILCRVRKHRQRLILSFGEILKDSNGDAWDLEIRGNWWVSDARRFLTARAASIVSPEVPFTREMAQTWMSSVVRSHVLDAVKAHTIEELRDRDALPATWWSKHMTEWLDAAGISVEVHECEWTSADAARAEAERRRLEELARMEAEQERERQALMRRDKLEAEHAEHRLRIEHDQRLSALERDAQLQQAERRHRAELLRLEAGCEEIRQRKERAAIEHELAVAKLTGNLKALREAEAQRAKLEERHAEIAHLLAETKAALERLGNVPELLQKLVDRDERQAHQATERILSPEFASLGLNADMLAVLGYRVPVQTAWQVFSDRARQQEGAVRIEKAELRTRDIGAAKVKALKIGTSLAFSFESARPGYVTMLNLGTSGRVWVHVPSALRKPEDARVEAGRRYTVPGPELFPWPHDYREEGPGGWEHIVVVVSDQPLILGDATKRLFGDSPLLQLDHEELTRLVGQLNDSPDSWVAGVLSFLVEAA